MSTRKLIMWKLSPSLFTLHFSSLKVFIAHMVSINLVYKGGGIGAAGGPWPPHILARTWATPYDHALID